MLKSVETCVIHPGDAHRDDTLCAAVAIHLCTLLKVIFRRDPTPAELQDPTCLVLDVGGQWEPPLMNFDHHQLTEGDGPAAECALSLFARQINLHLVDGDVNLEDAFELSNWFETTILMDSQGPFKTAARLGITPDALFSLVSPIEGAVTAMIKSEKEIREGTLLWSFLRRLGKELVDFNVDRYVRIHHELPEKVLIRSIPTNEHPHRPDTVEAMILESTDTTGLETYRSLKCPGTILSITHDDRGDGWTLYRYDDAPLINFAKLSDDDRVLFAHPGGFIAKTKERLPLDEVIELAKNGFRTAEEIASLMATSE